MVYAYVVVHKLGTSLQEEKRPMFCLSCSLHFVLRTVY